MSIKPLQDRVLVRRTEEDEVQEGTIIIPDTAKEKPQRGEILAVGDGRISDDGTRQAMAVKIGDKVLFAKYAGSDIKLNGEEVLIMREDDILGIIQ